MSLSVVTEETSLLPTTISPPSTPNARPIRVLAELIGARNLPLEHNRAEPYCVVQYGSKYLHRTQPLVKSTKASAVSAHNPIWSIKESPLFIVEVTKNDIENNKTLVVTLWLRVGKRKSRHEQTHFCGKIQIKASKILAVCTEERIEWNLVDRFGQPGQNSDESLAMRFRPASEADVRFVTAWNHATEVQGTMIPRTILNGTGVVPQEHRTRANLVTELDEGLLSGAKLSTAISSSMSSSLPKFKRSRKVRVKPFSDPTASKHTLYMTPADLKSATQLPSREWVEAGSGTLGQIFVEILSCKDLPNVDIGNAVGNRTDAFVSMVYGDAMVQTCVIDDELSPQWLPWTQRAFVLNMMHPSQVLYLAVFGYKSGLLNHVPIGRVEINPVNLQNNTVYDLRYCLFHSSHTTDRKGRGSIRIRLRLNLKDERQALLTSLTPYPDVHVNVQKKKSLSVARYTCCGEYDNEEKFNLKVLLAYIDEIKDSYIRRLLYTINDSAVSLFYWRGQVQVGWFNLPLYSLTVFLFGILAVERPKSIPGLCCLGIAMVMLVNMWARKQSPSPWHRCFSFGHYFQVLVFGKAFASFTKIIPFDSWEEQKAIDENFQKRKTDDDIFLKKKEAAEKELEAIENISVDTKSKVAILPVEILVVLGKLQGIVGGICRTCRSIDVILSWESSDISFWITTALILLGVVFLFLPWGFLLKWTGRFLVILLLGPQNKLIDIFTKKNTQDEKNLRELLAQRWVKARCRQEEAGKLKAFRHVLFGKYSTGVPTIMWTPHQDVPLPESEAHLFDSTKDHIVENVEDLPYIPGQQLYGTMIPRPYENWVANSAEVEDSNKFVTSVLRPLFDDSSPAPTPQSDVTQTEALKEEEGVEVSFDFDEEANLMEDPRSPAIKRKQMTREESLRGDWGVEIVNEYGTEAKFVQQSWRGSIHNFPLVEDDGESSEEETLPEDSKEIQEEMSNKTATTSDDLPQADLSDTNYGLGVKCSQHLEQSVVNYHTMGQSPQASLDTSGAEAIEQLEEDSKKTLIQRKLPSAQYQESLSEFGVEIVDLYDDEADFVKHSGSSGAS